MISAKKPKQKIAFLFICFLFLNGYANAQLSVGVQGTIGAFTGGVGILKGGGIEAGYGLLKQRRHKENGSKLFVCGSFNYYGGGKGSDYFDAYALNSWNPVYSVQVPYTWKLHLLQINVGAKYYIAGGMAAPFSFYGQLGLSAEIMPVKYTVASYDRSEYGGTEPESQTNVGIAFHAGLGFDVKAGPVHICLGTRLIIPANEVNGEAIEIVIPFAAVADLGIRVPIGEK